MKKYEIRMIFRDDHDSNKYYDWLDTSFANKKDALWYLHRVHGLAQFRLIRVTDGKQIAHKDGYDKVIMD